MLRREVVDLAGLHRHQARDGLQQLALTAAGHARHAEDLAAVEGKAGVVQRDHALGIDAGDVLDVQPSCQVHRLRAVDVQLHALAHHHLGQTADGGVFRLHGSDVLALAQHRHPVGQLQHLVELVGDDDDGVAIVAHVAQHVEQPLRLLRREHCGRLVENQDLRAAIEHLHDLHRLLFRHGHLVDLLHRIQLEAVLVGQLVDLCDDLCNVQLCGAGQAQHDVLRRREHVHQLEVLMDHADAQRKRVLGRADRDLLAVDKDLPLVGVVDARNHVHQRGLATAVFAEDGENFPRSYGKVDPVIGNHLAEPLGDVSQFDGVLVIHPTTLRNCPCDAQNPYIHCIIIRRIRISGGDNSALSF